MSAKSVSVLPSPKTHTPQQPNISIPPLLGASVEELTAWVHDQGQPAYRGKQLHDWIYQKGVRSLSDI
ncbi:MAG: 23S rRNA (adenine(2503)-C(2))-methyltransferase RlmN, partial [Microcoleus sp. SIO2G3]|nr:23S rRNA (adenine(2503)-C(2))-methyltransferase RlmN [Microcoleus sp. SIO2G3]